QRTPGAQEHLLREVVSQRGITAQPAQQIPQPRLAAAHQLGEGVVVAAHRQCDHGRFRGLAEACTGHALAFPLLLLACAWRSTAPAAIMSPTPTHTATNPSPSTG